MTANRQPPTANRQPPTANRRAGNVGPNLVWAGLSGWLEQGSARSLFAAMPPADKALASAAKQLPGRREAAAHAGGGFHTFTTCGCQASA